jgi:hypothetical protein
VGISKEQLIHTANSVMQIPLLERGYRFKSQGICTYGFMYEKIDNDIQYLIEIQPSGFNEGNLVDMFLNIHRKGVKPYGNYNGLSMFTMRVDSSIYRKEELKAQSWMWHLETEEGAEATFMGILPVVLDYAIPFLEDPQSSYSEVEKMLGDE